MPYDIVRVGHLPVDRGKLSTTVLRWSTTWTIVAIFGTFQKIVFHPTMALGGHKIVFRRRIGSTMLHDSPIVDHRVPTQAL